MMSAPALLNPREKNSLVVNITYGRGLSVLLSGFHSKSEGKPEKAVSVSAPHFAISQPAKDPYFSCIQRR